ncbi:MAG: hypothetical protein V4673_15020 [Pseudomonadota bacterium]
MLKWLFLLALEKTSIRIVHDGGRASCGSRQSGERDRPQSLRSAAASY